MRNWFKNPGIYTSILYIIASGYFGKQLFQLQLLKNRDMAIVMLGVVIIGAILFFMTLSKNRRRIARIFGNGFAIAFSILFLIGGFGLSIANSLISDITVQNVEHKDISLIVLKESDIRSVGDIKEDDTLGYQTICYPESAERMLKALKEERGIENPKQEFGTINEMVKGLYEEIVPIIILDEAYRNVLEEEYPTFTKDTRVIYTINYPEEEMNFVKDVNITKDSFVVLISGIDTYGKISSISRSDVNIIAVVNPVQAKILLISIPRDYYVPIMSGGSSIGRGEGQMDKLTHTGLFGPQCTMNTLEELFDIPIHYFVRVNFTSVVDIVDAIGGVTVQSDYAFGEFGVGPNECDGKKALSFARERYAFIDGDRQRGKNQMKIIEAIVGKLSNPTLEYDYLQLFQAVGDCVETNIPDADIKEFIQFQINDMPKWSMETTSVNGSDGKDYSYYSGQKLYVMYPEQASIDAAKERIRSVYFD